MTKQDIKFIMDQIKKINFETPNMPLSEWEIWTSGATTMYSTIMDMLYDLQIRSKISEISENSETLSTIPPEIKKGDE